MVSVLTSPSDIRLNVVAAEADTPPMTRRQEEQAVAARPGRLASLGGRLTRRSRARAAIRIDTEQELEALREKVSLLAMQKDYWHERSAEHADALRAAQAEVAHLNEVLDVLTDRVLVPR